MLVYEKKVNETNHLYGAPTNIPAETDTQLSYKDENGSTISDIAEYTLLYGTKALMKGNKTTLPASTDKEVNVFCGDTVIIGHTVTPPGPSYTSVDWDGVTTGLASNVLDDVTYYKVGDAIEDVTGTMFVDGPYKVYYDGDELAGTVGDASIDDQESVIIIDFSSVASGINCIVCKSDLAGFTPGVWFPKIGNNYIKSIAYLTSND